MYRLILAFFMFTLLGCAGSVTDSNEPAPDESAPPAVQVPVEAPVQAPAPAAVVVPACSDADSQACTARGDACGDRPEDSACYAFKDCYEGVQADPAGVAACVDANPDGATAWAELVQCICACEAPAGAAFCDGSLYGHPNG